MRWKLKKRCDLMKKTLINKNNFEKYINEGKFLVQDNFIVSPIVFDELDRMNIDIIYEKELNNLEVSLNKVENILREEYRIVNKSVISNVKAEVINRLK